VTLEYHSYCSDSRYYELEPQPNIKRADDRLKTYLFEGSATNPNSQFAKSKEDVIYYKLNRERQVVPPSNANEEDKLGFTTVHVSEKCSSAETSS
jgi:hypothetical protein